MGTDAWLCNFQGRKRFVLFHPQQRKYIEDQEGFIDLRVEPDLERFPNFHRATPLEFILHPGETVFIPKKWPHYAVALDDSVSLTVNFLSKVNRRAVLNSVSKFADRRMACEEILGRPISANDNLMKFCCHGGEINARLAAAVLGKTVKDLHDLASEIRSIRAAGGDC